MLLGVNTPVHVTPPSPLLIAPSVPFATVRSVASNPLTASVNVTVTVDVSPIFRALSLSVIVAVGAFVSTV